MLGAQEPGESRRGPQQHQAMVQGLRRVIARQVFAQPLQRILDLRERSIVLRGDSDRQGSEGGSIVLRVRYFPGRQIEVEPRPRSAVGPARLLHGPHVVERRTGLGAEASAARVIPGQHQRAQDGLGAAGLGALARPVALIGVEGASRVPQPYALSDVLHEPALGGGGSGLGERRAKTRARERIGHRGMAGEAESPLIAGRARPSHPPLDSVVKVRCGGLRIPGVRGYAPVRAGGNADCNAGDRSATSHPRAHG